MLDSLLEVQYHHPNEDEKEEIEEKKEVGVEPFSIVGSRPLDLLSPLVFEDSNGWLIMVPKIPSYTLTIKVLPREHNNLKISYELSALKIAENEKAEVMPKVIGILETNNSFHKAQAYMKSQILSYVLSMPEGTKTILNVGNTKQWTIFLVEADPRGDEALEVAVPTWRAGAK